MQSKYFVYQVHIDNNTVCVCHSIYQLLLKSASLIRNSTFAQVKLQSQKQDSRKIKRKTKVLCNTSFYLVFYFSCRKDTRYALVIFLASSKTQ